MFGLNKYKYYKGKRDFVHHYTDPNGKEKERVYHVYRDGSIKFSGTNRPMKRIIRETETAKGKKKYQVQVRMPDRFYNWERVVVAAWFDHFDIDDPEQIVRHRNDKKFDMRPQNLYVTTRRGMQENARYLDSAQVKAIKWLREKEKMSTRKLAKLYNIDRKMVQKVIAGTY